MKKRAAETVADKTESASTQTWNFLAVVVQQKQSG
jgi:hypothetical protein